MNSFDHRMSGQPGSDPRPRAADGTSSSGLVFSHPDEVVSHPSLTTAEQRALLASWLSDARAVQDDPTRRQLESGAIVRVEEILQALRRLDHDDEGRPARPARLMPRWRSAFPRRRGRLTSSWRPYRSSRSRDDDDDPPPFAAAAALIPAMLVS